MTDGASGRHRHGRHYAGQDQAPADCPDVAAGGEQQDDDRDRTDVGPGQPHAEPGAGRGSGPARVVAVSLKELDPRGHDADREHQPAERIAAVPGRDQHPGQGQAERVERVERSVVPAFVAGRDRHRHDRADQRDREPRRGQRTHAEPHHATIMTTATSRAHACSHLSATGCAHPRAGTCPESGGRTAARRAAGQAR